MSEAKIERTDRAKMSRKEKIPSAKRKCEESPAGNCKIRKVKNASEKVEFPAGKSGIHEARSDPPGFFDWSPHEKLAGKFCSGHFQTSKMICELFSNGNTIPFIARYRQDTTGGMSADELRRFKEDFECLKEVQKKGLNLLTKARKEGKDTDSWKKLLKQAASPDDLEILSAPLKKETKNTLAGRAKEIGLEPPALSILENKFDLNLSRLIDVQVEGRRNVEEVRQGIVHILVDIICHSKEIIEFLQEVCDYKKFWIVVESSKARETAAALKLKKESQVVDSKFEDYFEFRSLADNIKEHQVLALNRGEKQKVLSVKFTVDPKLEENFVELARKRFLHKNQPRSSVHTGLVEQAIAESFKRNIPKMLARKVWKSLLQEAELESIVYFSRNLRQLLLQPPIKNRVILAIDPGFRHGCKLAVIGCQGEVLSIGKIYPNFSAMTLSGSDKKVLRSHILKNSVSIVAIGNGCGANQTQQLMHKLVEEKLFGNHKFSFTIVNESGVSIYSCSPLADEEHPGMDPGLISAVSLARRVQDPMSEYVKVDPWHLGVGMYQHDLPQAKLKYYMESVVEECVSFVGLDLNYAQKHMLKKISGVGDTLAQAILDYRDKNGGFRSRNELRKVKGIGDKNFMSISGFVRIYNGKKTAKSEPLDGYLIHPENYKLAEDLIERQGLSKDDIGSEKFCQSFQEISKYRRRMQSKSFELQSSLETVQLIIDAFSQPLSYDFRQENSGLILRDSVTSIKDLSINMKCDGQVRNVVTFGAFVDIGVGQDGLVHKSKLKGRTLNVGEIVKVEILGVDGTRISLGLT